MVCGGASGFQFGYYVCWYNMYTYICDTYTRYQFFQCHISNYQHLDSLHSCINSTEDTISYEYICTYIDYVLHALCIVRACFVSYRIESKINWVVISMETNTNHSHIHTHTHTHNFAKIKHIQSKQSNKNTKQQQLRNQLAFFAPKKHTIPSL